ncbi:glycosyl transferase family 25 [Psychrobacter sp. PL19]|uniref:glycosyltransferase family 25 protein n=1 Tax=Psychrobacter sp. PL19 TaxID=2760711 RepID=UPI001AE6B74E
MKNIFVVSLISDQERRQHINALFAKNKLNFRYFDAINKLQVPDILKKYEIIANLDKVSVGEVACYLSHYCLWQQVVMQKLPYLIVFEDDIYFSKNAKEILDTLDWLPNDFDVIKLETMYDNVVIDNGVNVLPPHRLCHIKSPHMGTAGYIISHKGAAKLLSIVQEQGIDCPVDHLVFSQLVAGNEQRVYQLSPAICIQDKIYNEHEVKFDSVLEDERIPLQTIVKPKPSTKFNRELMRLQKQLKECPLKIFLALQGYRTKKINYKE